MSVLRGIWSDMVEKRLWPVAAALVVAVVALPVVLSRSAAQHFAAVSSAPAAVTPPAPAVTPAPANPDQQLAATVDGSRYQRNGHARDPFINVPPPKSVTSVSTASTGTPVATALGASVSAVTKATKTTSTAVVAPTQPPASVPAHINKPVSHKVPLYHVAAAFGVLGSTPKDVTLIQRQAAIPSDKNGLVSYIGVSGGKTVTFALLHAALPNGPGACRPSPTQCELISLKPGQTEMLEFLDGSSAGKVYALTVVSVVKRSGSSATVATASVRGQISAQGRALLRRLAGRVLAEVRYHMASGTVSIQPPAGS
jgi:hypothetical protein